MHFVLAGVFKRGTSARGGEPLPRCDVLQRVSRLDQVQGALRELKLEQVCGLYGLAVAVAVAVCGGWG